MYYGFNLSQNPPCFAFVVFKNKDDAQTALKEMDNRTLGSTRIRVTVAKPRSTGGRRRFDPNSRCYQCGERGHFSRDCALYSSRGGRRKRLASSSSSVINLNLYLFIQRCFSSAFNVNENKFIVASAVY